MQKAYKITPIVFRLLMAKLTILYYIFLHLLIISCNNYKIFAYNKTTNGLHSSPLVVEIKP